MTTPSTSCVCGHVLEDTCRFICGKRFTGKVLLNTRLKQCTTMAMLNDVATNRVDSKKDPRRIARSNNIFSVSYTFQPKLVELVVVTIQQ